MVLLRFPEGAAGTNLGCDWTPIRARGVQLSDPRTGFGKLTVRVSEDNAAILRAPVRPLAVNLGRIVQCKERVQKRLVTEAGVVEGNLNDLRMASAVGTYVLVSWVFEVSAFITYGCVDDSYDLVESCLNSPEASCSKCCFFDCHACCSFAAYYTVQLAVLQARR